MALLRGFCPYLYDIFLPVLSSDVTISNSRLGSHSSLFLQVIMAEEGEKQALGTEAVAPPKKPTTAWEILNSQFMLWVLGSVVLSGITAYWNHRTDQREEAQRQHQSAEKEKSDKVQRDIDRQREDSQFLGTMLPYLTSPDLNVRLRAVDVILARYPDGSLPPKVSQLTAKIIDSAGSSQTNQTEETKSLIASAVQQLPARVYLQIHDDGQRTKAKELQGLLRQQGLLVPVIEIVSAPVKQTSVRYFNDSDMATAEKVKDLLMKNGFPEAVMQKLGMKANPGTIEVWFPGTS